MKKKERDNWSEMNHNSGYATSQIFIGGRNPMVGEENIATGYIISHELTWTEQVVNRNMMQTDGAWGMSGTRKKKHQQQNRRHAKKADHNKKKHNTPNTDEWYKNKC